MKVETPSC